MANEIRGHNPHVRMPLLDIYKTTTDAVHSVGDRLALGHRVFRFAKANGSTALNAGELQQGQSPDSNNTGLSVNEPSAGDRLIEVDTGGSDFAEDEFKGGYLWLDTVTNGVMAYRIKSNEAATDSGTAEFEILDGFSHDVASGDTAALYPNPYNKVEVGSSYPGTTVVGVPLVDVGTDEYCWLQTWGPCSVKTDASTSATSGKKAQASSATDGEVEDGKADDSPQVGIFIRAESDGEQSLVDLMIAP